MLTATLLTIFNRVNVIMENTFSTCISARKYRDKKGKQVVYYDHQNLSYLCLCCHSVNNLRQFCASISVYKQYFNHSGYMFFLC